MNAIFSNRVKQISSVLATWPGPICVAYSGGKDSSAVIKLVASALKRTKTLRRDLKVVYCDTGVENPVVSAFVLKTLNSLSEEFARIELYDCIKILRPEVHQRFFVRLIGRGYPPPTQFFRWCTKDLRIRPVQKFIRNAGDNALVILGTRRGESAQRDRVLGKAVDGPFIQKQTEGAICTSVYSPIIDFDLTDVWSVLTEVPFPKSIDVTALAAIYRDGGGECPIIRETNDKPCASARFGCWTCTVVRRDKSAENLIEAGYSHVQPYHAFRRWLTEIRNCPEMRCVRRRNGTDGMGPFTLQARKVILGRVKSLEVCVNSQIIDAVEQAEIERLWKMDLGSSVYRLIDPTAGLLAAVVNRKN
jgi:DNA sulfur modification protein DndC